MSRTVETLYSQIERLWQSLTGEPLWCWTHQAPADVPEEVRRQAQDATTPFSQYQHAGRLWAVGRLGLTSPTIYLASLLSENHPAVDLTGIYQLMTQLIELEDERQRLKAALVSAQQRLDLLSELSQLAWQQYTNPQLGMHVVQLLGRFFPAEDIAIHLWNNGLSYSHSASGLVRLPLSSLQGICSPQDPLVRLLSEGHFPVDLHQALPGATRLLIARLELQAHAQGILLWINPAIETLSSRNEQILACAARQIGLMVSLSQMVSPKNLPPKLDHELAVASQIQVNFLPVTLPVLPGLEFAASLMPAHRVGGDFYDVQTTPHGTFIVVGDVAGKGMPAALLSALIHATLKSEIQHHRQTAALLQSINALLYEELDRSETFITAFLAYLQTDPFQLSYASAGHTTTLLWQADKEQIHELSSTGLPLGITPGLEIDQRIIPLQAGDSLVLYTDGITEAQNESGRVFGMQALIDLIIATHTASAQRQLHAILTALDLHRGKLPLRDDVALFIARAQPPEAARLDSLPFVFTAEIPSIRRLVTLVRETAASLASPDDPAGSSYLDELELAISEIATNIVLHAYRDSPYQGRLQGTITRAARSIRIDLIDSGIAFPALARSPEENRGVPPTSGYGLPLARRLLDNLCYRRLSGERNHWLLEKSFPSPTNREGYLGISA